MSKRLQVLLDEQEWDELRAVARREGLTVSEWVRRSVRDARRRKPGGDFAGKLEAIRAAAGHEFPTADIDEMLADIEGGYRSPLPE
jgi:hypothetical protein